MLGGGLRAAAGLFLLWRSECVGVGSPRMASMWMNRRGTGRRKLG